MRVTVTGATGLIGTRLVAALARRGDEVTVLSRDPRARARAARLRHRGGRAGTRSASRRPTQALAGRDGVIHLAGEPVAQRWSAAAKERIRTSRESGTAQPRRRPAQRRPAPARARLRLRRRLLRPARRRAGRRVDAAGRGLPRARCASRGSARRRRPRELGMRVAIVRTGVVLDPRRRRAREDAAAVPRRRRRAGRRRAPVDAVDPRRRPRRPLPRRARRRRRLERPGQRQRARAGHEPRLLEGARPRAAPPGGRARAARSRCARSTARWSRSSRPGSAPCRRAPLALGYALRAPASSTRRCAQRSPERRRPPSAAGEAQPCRRRRGRRPSGRATCRPPRRSRTARARRRAARSRSRRARPRGA